jgi:hypothetical protein
VDIKWNGPVYPIARRELLRSNNSINIADTSTLFAHYLVANVIRVLNKRTRKHKIMLDLDICKTGSIGCGSIFI